MIKASYKILCSVGQTRFINYEGQYIIDKQEQGEFEMVKANIESLGITQDKEGNYETVSVNPSIKAGDLGKVGKKTPAFITDVVERTFDDGTKIVLSLSVASLEKTTEGMSRTMGLNKTNTLNMLTAYGEEYEDWVGKAVSLNVENTLFKGKQVPCIRIYSDD